MVDLDVNGINQTNLRVCFRNLKIKDFKPLPVDLMEIYNANDQGHADKYDRYIFGFVFNFFP